VNHKAIEHGLSLHERSLLIISEKKTLASS